MSAIAATGHYAPQALSVPLSAVGDASGLAAQLVLNISAEPGLHATRVTAADLAAFGIRPASLLAKLAGLN